MDAQQATALLKRYRSGTCTPAEQQLVESWFSRLEAAGQWEWQPGQKEAVEDALEARLLAHVMPAQVKPMRSSAYKWIAVAAALILVVAGTWWFIRPDAGNSSNNQQLARETIKPVGNKATLTLSDGRTIILDSANSGTISDNNGVQIINLASGQLSYKTPGSQLKTPDSFNTLSTPRGGQYQVILPDGTQVWLNAQTTLRYPEHFAENERIVMLEKGEAYFSVTQDAHAPFFVETAWMKVQVLGTAFNINTYTPAIKTTLVEGKVQVTPSSGPPMILQPNQQAVFNRASGSLSKATVDVEPFVAWKDGWMIFDESTLEEVMEALGRWYNCDIAYTSPELKTIHFGGKFRRYQHVGEVLASIEKTGSVQFTVKDRTIVVSSR